TGPNYLLDVAGSVDLNDGVSSGQALFVNGKEALWSNGTYFSWGYGNSYNYFVNGISIGNTASPLTPLEITKDTGSGTEGDLLRLNAVSGGTGNGPGILFTNNNDVLELARIAGLDSGNWGGGLAFYTSPGTGSSPGGTPTERMFINDIGQVGINTTDPNFGGKVSSIFSIETTPSDGTGLTIADSSGTPSFAVNPNGVGGWIMFDHQSGSWLQDMSANNGAVTFYNQINSASNSGSGGYISSGGYGGTGNAAYFPDGLWSNGTTAWIYGTINTNSVIVDTAGRMKLNPAGTSWLDGGDVGINNSSPNYSLDVTGDIHATGWLRTDGSDGWYSQTYGGGWFMQDSTWIRTYNGTSVWTANGLLGTQGGVTSGYGGTAPPLGGAIFSGTVGIGTNAPNASYGLDVSGSAYIGGSLTLGGVAKSNWPGSLAARSTFTAVSSGDNSPITGNPIELASASITTGNTTNVLITGYVDQIYNWSCGADNTIYLTLNGTTYAEHVIPTHGGSDSLNYTGGTVTDIIPNVGSGTQTVELWFSNGAFSGSCGDMSVGPGAVSIMAF
ncbi:MAG: shufflon system plasmid conjugative transfer pilus tip adhesin PilV, partial [Patescibacteria group bacterium]|nr:shufflon system plasmid conjugative transfer pilus tip adhesin PilV [Patescibacteria group bacterium]